MGMLDIFTTTGIPDNRFTFNYNDDVDEIIPGGSCCHVFEFPFIYAQTVKSCQIIYKQGIHVIKVVEVKSEDVEENYQNYSCVIHVNLSPRDTLLFKSDLLKTYAQARVITLNGETLFDEPHRIWVKTPLTTGILVPDENIPDVPVEKEESSSDSIYQGNFEDSSSSSDTTLEDSSVKIENSKY